MTQGRIEVEGWPFVIDWSVSAANKAPGPASGDGYLIARADDRVLIAVVDGSGSGDEAGQAAQDCLEELSASLSLAMEAAFDACHRRLRGTRGAALALAEITLSNPIRLTWASVGDVDGQVLRPAPTGRRPQFSVVQCSGTLGFAYDRLNPQSHPMLPGDMLLLTTDGISREYRGRGTDCLSAADLTRTTLQQFGRPTDDRLALALAIVPAT